MIPFDLKKALRKAWRASGFLPDEQRPQEAKFLFATALQLIYEAELPNKYKIQGVDHGTENQK